MTFFLKVQDYFHIPVCASVEIRGGDPRGGDPKRFQGWPVSICRIVDRTCCLYVGGNIN